ncbi:hypothetical protein [Lacisediminimonas profundi]|uniref:hypothetical protein n=1 Tax=Lacisediminimonas profundi TaxID=2603856 RepID=UPI00124B0136|nr:hypothetical protein [Lacisediminimonas profundi]
MKNYLAILPIALLVTYSQVMVKWRSGIENDAAGASFASRLLNFASDPVILSAYAAALLASFAWLYVVSKLPLTIAFPVYIGVTFVMVMVSGWIFLAEAITVTKLLAVALILGGIILGMNADG